MPASKAEPASTSSRTMDTLTASSACTGRFTIPEMNNIDFNGHFGCLRTFGVGPSALRSHVGLGLACARPARPCLCVPVSVSQAQRDPGHSSPDPVLPHPHCVLPREQAGLASRVQVVHQPCRGCRGTALSPLARAGWQRRHVLQTCCTLKSCKSLCWKGAFKGHLGQTLQWTGRFST